MAKKLDKKAALKKGGKTLNEFKEFISRGNVVDLAVGVIIGSAFGKIVSSIVDDILMPLLGIVIGGLDFSNLSITIGDAKVKYGMFIQNVIDFLIVAACIFFLVKLINKLNRKKEEDPIEEIEETVNEELETLKEIRDLLKKGKK